MALLSTGDRVRLGLRRLKRVGRRPLDTLDDLGDQLGFYGRALAWGPARSAATSGRPSGCSPR